MPETKLCRDCGRPFTLTTNEVTFYTRAAGMAIPVRCENCRRTRRLLRLQTVTGKVDELRDLLDAGSVVEAQVAIARWRAALARAEEHEQQRRRHRDEASDGQHYGRERTPKDAQTLAERA